MKTGLSVLGSFRAERTRRGGGPHAVGATRPESIRTWVQQGQINLRPGAPRPLNRARVPQGQEIRPSWATRPDGRSRRTGTGSAGTGTGCVPRPAPATSQAEQLAAGVPPRHRQQHLSARDRLRTRQQPQEQCLSRKESRCRTPANRQEQCLSLKRSPARAPTGLRAMATAAAGARRPSRPARREARERPERLGCLSPDYCGSRAPGCHPRAFGTRLLVTTARGDTPKPRRPQPVIERTT